MKKASVLVFAGMMFLPALFIWGGGQPPAEEGPIPITIYRGGIDFDAENDPSVQEINKRLNVKISFVTAPWSENRQKVNLILSTGEPVDIVTTVENIPKWADEGAVIALDDYISEDTHPYIYKLVNSDTFTPLKIDGKAYAIPQMPLGIPWGTFIRKDWLDKLGLKMPTNEEELYQVAKAFRAMDPSGKITGFQFEGDKQIRRTTIPIMSMFGVPSSFWDQRVNWDIKDGKLTHIATMDNTKAALKYMNRLYNEGLINHDFPSMNSFPDLTQKYMFTGSAGLGWVIWPFTAQERSLKEIDPTADVAVLQPFSAKGYTFRKAQGLMVQIYAVVSSQSKHPEKAIECLEFFNSYEGRQLLVAGVQGVHWSSFNDDGTFERIEENWNRDYQGQYHPLNFYLGQGNCEGYIPADKYDTFEEAYANAVPFLPTSLLNEVNITTEYKEGAKWCADPNPLQFVQFPEHNDLEMEVQMAIVTGWTKCIAAKPGEFEKTWQDHQAELERVGLDRWTALYQEYYDKNIK